MKTCTKCGQSQPVEDFFRRTRARDGRSSWCKACHAEYDRVRYGASSEERSRKNRNTSQRRARNRDFVLTYLATHPCIDCGESDPVVLEFDHISGDDKRAEISNLISWGSIRSIEAEIQKCAVRCANCHKRRTALQFGWYKAGELPAGA